MTIRRLLYRRKRLYVVLHTVGLLGVIFAAMLGELAHRAWSGVALTLLALTLWAWYGSMARVRCPRCDGNIGHLGLNAMIGIPYLSKPIVYCPYCKVDLDVPVESGASPASD